MSLATRRPTYRYQPRRQPWVRAALEGIWDAAAPWLTALAFVGTLGVVDRITTQAEVDAAEQRADRALEEARHAARVFRDSLAIDGEYRLTLRATSLADLADQAARAAEAIRKDEQ